MRKSGSDMYGIGLEKKIERFLSELFTKENEVRVIDICKIIDPTCHYNTYRRVLNALKNIQQEGLILMEKKPFGRFDLPTFIIRPKKCSESPK